MKGTLFELDVSDDEVEYAKPKGNKFSVRYRRHSNIDEDEMQVAVSYTKQPAGIQLQTVDGQPIQDGDHIGLTHLSEEGRGLGGGSENHESGRLVFVFDITDDHKPVLAWDEVRFTILFRGDETTSFTRRFGGYPGISEDYNEETGEFEL